MLIFCGTCVSLATTTLGMQASIFGAIPSQDKVEGLQQEGHKNGGMIGGGLLISLDGVAPIWMVGVSPLSSLAP